jgi:hypothetical protein
LFGHAELGDGFADAIGDFGIDGAAVVQDARDGGDGDAGVFSDARDGQDRTPFPSLQSGLVREKSKD